METYSEEHIGDHARLYWTITPSVLGTPRRWEYLREKVLRDFFIFFYVQHTFDPYGLIHMHSTSSVVAQSCTTTTMKIQWLPNIAVK